MNKNKEIVGIDMSKSKFDVCYADGSHSQFDNTLSGFEAFIATLSSNSHCVMEQTGNYHYPLACYLSDQGYLVSVENALVIKRFIQMKLKRAKTDKADARMIFEYGKHFSPKAWNRPKPYIAECRQIRSLVGLLQKQKTALTNQREGFRASGECSEDILSMIQEQLVALKSKIKQLEKRMEDMVKSHEGTMLTNLSSIKGIAKRTAILLIIHTNGFADFENAKQLSAYLGLSPQIRQSGTSLNIRGTISKSGNKDLRKMMFMCALSASVYNKSCSDQFQRMIAKGKSKKTALVAISNKLLKQALAIGKSGIPYDPEFVSVKRG